MSKPPVLTGLDRLLVSDCAMLANQKVGLVVHPASVNRALRHASSLLQASPAVELHCLFGPQHGFRGETQDNMVEWAGYRHPGTGLAVHSLYGRVRKPTAEMLQDIDTLVVDLQDVGARYYTFIWTMLLCLEACAEQGKRMVVLDRPNPIGGLLREGNVLDVDYRSFVGLAPIPMRHGLTMGELALLFRTQFQLAVELEVVWMTGWRRDMWFDETGLPWVMPSPNMPSLDTAAAYPGFCLLEGTELSEGRGTTRPFEICGAPYIDPDRLVHRLTEWDLPGCTLRPMHFQPTFQKHAGKICGGVQVHVSDRVVFRPVLTATAVLAAVRELWPDQFRWREPPYEYEFEKRPIDILAGGKQYREGLEAGLSPWEVAEFWQDNLDTFEREVQEHLHYE